SRVRCRARTASRNTTSCCASKRTSARRRAISAAPPSARPRVSDRCGCAMQLRTAADIAVFIVAEPWRRAVLDAVRRQRLPDWAVGAGFIRSAVWDALHGYTKTTPLSDVDVLFFDG